IHLAVVASLLLGLLAGCTTDNTETTPTPATMPKPNNALEITMAYSSEKKPFIEPLADAFNRARHMLGNRPIYITARVADSGTEAQMIAQGQDKPTVWSPSSSLWRSVLNYEADKELVGPSDPIFLNPVVIAMWKPMAEALGYPNKALGLADSI